ncbi:conserved hypothetical protein [Candidatus Sulfotelmatomonas gaucii]|uniref:Uncharacterized protein n=1 Tax=Candidatus Sulfuritelmatomonas gaucii TaxID=2043161 RepID=A0A2N9L4C4_9BACT|nr:conserved hypothetical protein [Candidatus Sulfotelmatomonas gaucii]
MSAGLYALQLRQELTLRNRAYARGHAHVESYGSDPVIVYAPDGDHHGNFFDPAYAAITRDPDWMCRFDKVHAQAARSLPKPQLDPHRRWRELDSSMSSDALLMNIFCTPGAAESAAVRNMLGVEDVVPPLFGWKARVPLANGRFDRTEVDMRFGSLLVEAKLTEVGFQARIAAIVEAYRDFEEVFDRDQLPRVEIPTSRWLRASEFPENESQEFESVLADPELFSPVDTSFRPSGEEGYASYQLIRSVLAAHASNSSFCVIHDERRPDLRAEWFQIMSAVKSAEMRTRLKVLTWQELAAILPAHLQDFLDLKYGIVAPGKTPSPIEGVTDIADL